MSHNIHMDKKSGEGAIAYVGAMPWHGYGQKIEEENAYDLIGALNAAHANFTVETVPMFHQLPGSLGMETWWKPFDNHVIIRRVDTLAPLGTATDRYVPIQVADAMKYLEALLGVGKVKIEVVFVIGNGEKVGVLAKIEEGQLPILGDDVIEKYILAVCDHTGNATFLNLFTPVRTVCQNTLTMALGRAKTSETIKIRHTGDIKDKLKFAADLLRAAGIFFDEVAESYRYIAAKQVGADVTRDYFIRVCEQRGSYKDLDTLWRNKVDAFESAHETGRGSDLKGVRGTLWGAYNAVTEVVDHKFAAKNKEPLRYLTTGTGRDVKKRALNVALDIADAMN